MRKQEGFTLIELMVVILIIGILVAIAVPVFFAAQSNAQAGACKDNLRTIDSAIMQYSAAHEGAYPGPAAADVQTLLSGTYIRANPTFPTCKVAGSEYTWSDPGTSTMRTVCTYSDPHTY